MQTPENNAPHLDQKHDDQIQTSQTSGGEALQSRHMNTKNTANPKCNLVKRLVEGHHKAGIMPDADLQ
jgi:hypothetical protein